MTDIKWTTETRRLGDLIPWESNPRQLTKEQASRLRESITEFGYSQLYEIEPDNTIIDGHQRDEIMLRMDEFGADAEIEVRVAPRKFTVEERKKYIALKHRGAVGEWDWDAMHNLYDFEELDEWGFGKHEILVHGYQVEGSEVDYLKEWEGMPEFEQGDKSSYRRLIVHFMSQDDVKEFCDLIGQQITEKTKSIYHPKLMYQRYGEVIANES